MCFLVFMQLISVCLNYRETHTYAVPILVKGQGAVPGVQVHSYDGALTKARGELHFVSFVLEETFKQMHTETRCNSFYFRQPIFKTLLGKILLIHKSIIK